MRILTAFSPSKIATSATSSTRQSFCVISVVPTSQRFLLMSPQKEGEGKSTSLSNVSHVGSSFNSELDTSFKENVVNIVLF